MARPNLLVLRAAQIRALRLGARNRFREKLARHVAEVFPGHAAFVRLRHGHAFLDRCLDAAARHGLRDEHSAALYTDLVVALGEGFEQQPTYGWIRDVLQNQQLGGPARMFLIYKDLPERCPGEAVPPPPDPDGDGAPRSLPPLVLQWPAGRWE